MTETKNIILVYRDKRFSPNSVEKDKAILDAVGHELQQSGIQVRYVAECEITGPLDADGFLSMGRLDSTLSFLQQKEREGMLVVNGSQGVRDNTRVAFDQVLRKHKLPAAPLVEVGKVAADSGKSFWLKCDEPSCNGKTPVVYADDVVELVGKLAAIQQQGRRQVVVTEHVDGSLLKFYGVQGTEFFRYFYPEDDETCAGETASGSGGTHHSVLDEGLLRQQADTLSRLMDVKIYGGDCIVRKDGSYAFIDFNDWPSFSRCRLEAAKAIVSLVLSDQRIIKK